MIKWKVEEIKSLIFDENGRETGIWEGYAVRNIDHPSRYCFECRDKTNAEMLCEFLNIYFCILYPDVYGNLFCECVNNDEYKEGGDIEE